MTVAIEVEFKEDWLDAMVRLISVSLAASCASEVINLIVSEKEEDYFNIRNIATIDMIALLPVKVKFTHINKCSLNVLLKQIRLKLL